MRIKYVWHDEPNNEKEFDTIEQFYSIPFIFRKILDKTQEEYEEFILKRLEENVQSGLVLRYEIVG